MNVQRIETSFGGWQETIDQLGGDCRCLAPMKPLDASPLDNDVAMYVGKCWLMQTQPVSRYHVHTLCSVYIVQRSI